MQVGSSMFLGYYVTFYGMDLEEEANPICSWSVWIGSLAHQPLSW
jgi:hypothetical protein